MEEEKKKNPLLTFLVIVNTIFVAIILYNQSSITDQVQKITQDTSSHPQGGIQSPYYPKAKKNFKVVEYPFGNFTANLARPSGPQRFLKTEMTLLVETPKADTLSEIINKTPVLRDEIISLFNNKTPRDILKLEGREVLKNHIKEHINKQLKTDQIRRILFTKFTVN